MLLTEHPPPGPRHLADRSDRRLFEIRHLLEHASEHPRPLDAGVYLRIETWRLLQVLR